MKKKTQNQEMIQQFMDEGEYAPLYPFVSRSKLSEYRKILISLMLNDIRMNGSRTWKHQTYADKSNTTRVGVWKQFKQLTELGIIIPSDSNKPGSKGNTYTVSFSAITDYEPVNAKHKPVNDKHIAPVNLKQEPVNLKQEPVNIEPLPVNDKQQPVNRGYHIKKPKETNKENNKESKEDIFDNVSFFGNNKIKNSNQEYLDSRKKELTNIDIDLLGSTDFFDGLDI